MEKAMCTTGQCFFGLLTPLLIVMNLLFATVYPFIAVVDLIIVSTTVAYCCTMRSGCD